MAFPSNEQQVIMKRRLSLCLCLGLLMISASCRNEAKDPEKVLRPVQYQEVQYRGGARIRTFSGTAQTEKVIDLSFRTSGILTALNMRVGQRVTKGMLLAELDNVAARLALEQAVSALNSAASQMNTAKLNYERVRSLYEKGSASLSDFENAKNSFRTAEASFESAQRSVDIQNEQISYAYIYAPENGTIAALNAEIDENVVAGQPIAVLNAGSEMEIALGLPENVINSVRVGMDVDVSFTSLPGPFFSGRVSEVSPSVDRSSATYPVQVLILDPSEDVRSGMTADVTFDFGEPRSTGNTLVVPAKAVGEDEQGRFVFLIDESDAAAHVKKQPIRIGELTPEGFEVLDGLSAGQKIATAGMQTLLDGQEVRLPD